MMLSYPPNETVSQNAGELLANAFRCEDVYENYNFKDVFLKSLKKSFHGSNERLLDLTSFSKFTLLPLPCNIVIEITVRTTEANKKQSRFSGSKPTNRLAKLGTSVNMAMSSYTCLPIVELEFGANLNISTVKTWLLMLSFSSFWHITLLLEHEGSHYGFWFICLFNRPNEWNNVRLHATINHSKQLAQSWILRI